MTPILIIKTANGYAVMPYTGEIPQADIASLSVATALSGHSWRDSQNVQDIIAAHFEPPQPASIKEAA